MSDLTTEQKAALVAALGNGGVYEGSINGLGDGEGLDFIEPHDGKWVLTREGEFVAEMTTEHELEVDELESQRDEWESKSDDLQDQNNRLNYQLQEATQ